MSEVSHPQNALTISPVTVMTSFRYVRVDNTHQPYHLSENSPTLHTFLQYNECLVLRECDINRVNSLDFIYDIAIYNEVKLKWGPKRWYIFLYMLPSHSTSNARVLWKDIQREVQCQRIYALEFECLMTKVPSRFLHEIQIGWDSSGCSNLVGQHSSIFI